MVQRFKVDDASIQVKDFIRALELEKGPCVVEIDGVPAIGVVPPWQVEKLSRDREEVLSLLRRSWERNRSVSEDEAERAITEAIREVRRDKRQSETG
jgi:hypothetical protein